MAGKGSAKTSGIKNKASNREADVEANKMGDTHSKAPAAADAPTHGAPSGSNSGSEGGLPSNDAALLETSKSVDDTELDHFNAPEALAAEEDRLKAEREAETSKHKQRQPAKLSDKKCAPRPAPLFLFLSAYQFRTSRGISVNAHFSG